MTTEEKITVIIVDDIAETRENIRKLLQFDPSVEVIGVARTGAEGIQVATESKPDVVLMDINMPDMDGIAATEKIRTKLPATQIVILSVQSDSNYMRRAMLAGARDFLTKPPDVDELTSAIQRAGAVARQEKMKEATTRAAIQAAGPSGTGKLIIPGLHNGKIITVYGPKGGTGATTITANLAVALQSDENPVVVVDGRLQFGDLSFFFNEQTKTNLIDLTSRSDELDPEVVQEVLIKHETTGISILAAPQRPEQAEEVRASNFVEVLRYLRGMFEYIIIDTGSGLDDVTLAAIDTSDLVIVITTQDIPSIKNIRLFFDLTDALGYPREQAILVMNRFDKRRNVTPDRVSEIAKSPVVATLPLEEKFVIPAMDRGVPFLIQNQSHPVSRGIYDLAKGIKERIVELEELKEEAS
ncbi:MAG: response regulator [Anaerolineales bacterium]|jgi:pilus assembly protein CpaE